MIGGAADFFDGRQSLVLFPIACSSYKLTRKGMLECLLLRNITCKDVDKYGGVSSFGDMLTAIAVFVEYLSR